MDYVSQESQLNWRNRCKEFFRNEVSDKMVKFLDPTSRVHGTGMSFEEIYQLDLRDLKECDLVLADVRYMPVENTGSAAELMYAYEVLRKPIIGWCDDEHKPQGLRLFMNVMVKKQLPSLEASMEHIKEFYLKEFV